MVGDQSQVTAWDRCRPARQRTLIGRACNGQALRIFDCDEPDLADFQPFFTQVSKKKVVIEGVDFWMVDGTGFRYPPYRDTVLAKIAHELHHIPRWLPLYGNPFCERYGFGECSPKRR